HSTAIDTVNFIKYYFEEVDVAKTGLQQGFSSVEIEGDSLAMIQKVKEKKVEIQRFNDLGLRKQISSGIGELFGSFQADDRVLEASIHNMEEPPILKIRGRSITARSAGGWANHHEISGGSGESGPLQDNVGEGPEYVKSRLDID
ncbi:hypothetical protein Goari_014399, partial [Gossypium aridum]|nr:hypothetical protein [Gossypium aridum]